MINPILTNYRIDFGDNFFPKEITQKYDNFLFHKNYPFKTLKGYFYETIQNCDIPGIALNELLIAGLNNLGQNPSLDNFPHSTINRSYSGTAPENEIVEGTKINITFRNTVLNWMYCFEVLKRYYARTRTMKDFYILLTFMDSAEIPIIRFKFSDCFASSLPGLSFAYNQSFSESKTFDCAFTFNQMGVDLIIPDFNVNQV